MSTVTLHTEELTIRDSTSRPTAATAVSAPPTTTTTAASLLASDQILKPRPVIRSHPHTTTTTSGQEEKYLHTLEGSKDEAASEERRQELVQELAHHVHLYDALQGHNRHLRERITKEGELLAKTCEEIHQLPLHAVPVCR